MNTLIKLREMASRVDYFLILSLPAKVFLELVLGAAGILKRRQVIITCNPHKRVWI